MMSYIAIIKLEFTFYDHYNTTNHIGTGYHIVGCSSMLIAICHSIQGGLMLVVVDAGFDV